MPGAEDYAAALLPIVRDSGLAIILEPGRAIVGPAGVLVSRVVDVKPQGGDKLFVILDAGMTELIRPMLYNAFHRIEPVNARGPTRGHLRRRRTLVRVERHARDAIGSCRSRGSGDLVAILDAGAYSSVMASNYNRRPMPAEVMVDNGRASVIRRRQTIDDLVALET